LEGCKHVSLSPDGSPSYKGRRYSTTAHGFLDMKNFGTDLNSLFGQSAVLVDESALNAWYVAPCIDWVQSQLAKDTELDGALVVVQCCVGPVPKWENREPLFYTVMHYRVTMLHYFELSISQSATPCAAPRYKSNDVR
jgi:hypothetical protein